MYHIIFRGIERKPIFRDDEDRSDLLNRLGDGLACQHTACYAWALMSNHAHLALSPAEQPLSTLLHPVLTGYAGAFNRRHHRAGHLLQNRYRSILCQKDIYFLELIRYIHLNPIRSGFITDLRELDDYPWTGHSSLMGTCPRDWQNHDEVLRMFGTTRHAARTRYRNFLSAGIGVDPQPDLAGGGIRRSLQGRAKTAPEMRIGDERILGEAVFVEETLATAGAGILGVDKTGDKSADAERITRHVCRYYGVTSEMLRKKWKRHPAAEAKAIWAYLLKKELGESGSQIGRRLGISPAAAAYLIDKGESCIIGKSDILTF